MSESLSTGNPGARGITRRRFLRDTVGGLSLAAAAAACTPHRRARQPDVLFIVIDDLNDWTGCLGGHPQAQTPHLDALAARGILFDNAHCASPLCNPSRTTLLTGIEVYTHKIFQNGKPFRDLLPDALTLPQCFMAGGYEAIGYGKLFHMEDPQSWQEAYIPQRPKRYKPPLFGISSQFDWGPIDTAESEMFDVRLADRAIEAMSRPRTKPLFLGVGFLGPHLPWHVPRADYERFGFDPATVTLPTVPADDLDDLGPEARSLINIPQNDHRKILRRGLWRSAVASYLAAGAYTDLQLGRVLEAWRQQGRDENGIVVLTSDHGWHLGEKKHWRKSTLWEESTRVPLIVGGGALDRSPDRCHQPVSLVDLYPTLVELCDLDRPTVLEGKSLLPLIANPSGDWQRPAICTHTRHRSARSRDWRYIRYESGEEELYDHVRDPNEWTNLAREKRHAEVKNELAGWLPASDV